MNSIHHCLQQYKRFKGEKPMNGLDAIMSELAFGDDGNYEEQAHYEAMHKKRTIEKLNLKGNVVEEYHGAFITGYSFSLSVSEPQDMQIDIIYDNPLPSPPFGTPGWEYYKACIELELKGSEYGHTWRFKDE